VDAYNNCLIFAYSYKQQQMRKLTKITLIIATCISITAMSCARRNATGCPAWGKTNQPKTTQKSV